MLDTSRHHHSLFEQHLTERILLRQEIFDIATATSSEQKINVAGGVTSSTKATITNYRHIDNYRHCTVSLLRYQLRLAQLRTLMIQLRTRPQLRRMKMRLSLELSL